MSENGDKPLQAAKTELPGTTLQLVITWDQVTGQIQVTGPIGNPVLAKGMMEEAKKAIDNYQSAMQKGVVLANANPNLRM